MGQDVRDGGVAAGDGGIAVEGAEAFRQRIFQVVEGNFLLRHSALWVSFNSPRSNKKGKPNSLPKSINPKIENLNIDLQPKRHLIDDKLWIGTPQPVYVRRRRNPDSAVD